MPWTPKQRALFHEVEENSDAARRHGMTRAEGSRLAREADKLAREGTEKRPAAKSALPEGVIDLAPVFGEPPG